MAVCEKCWTDARQRVLTHGGAQIDHYHELLKERKDNPCSSREQESSTHDNPELLQQGDDYQCSDG